MNDKQGTNFSLKDHLFNEKKVLYLADSFCAADEKFAARAFVRHVMKQLLQLKLKARIVLIATVLESYLAADFLVAAKQIVTSLPEPLDPALTDDDFGDFIFALLGEFDVIRNGLAKKHRPSSLKTLKQLCLKKGESAVVSKRHVLRANATTYSLYPGIHYVTLQINGQPFRRLSFELLPAK